MSDWSSGYVADIEYTYGYYAELNPARIRQAFFSAGLIPPTVTTACELGFGQGLSTAIHAAASEVHWCGTDFNPAQAGFAQELEQVSQSGARLVDQAFAEFCTRDDLPDFDFIGLHGIWSWISDENRQIIVDFVRRKLKVGGVLYISYNTEPGWANMVPMRRLMTEHSAVMSPPGIATTAKVDSALGFIDKLMAAQPTYAVANPHLAERLGKIGKQNRNYLSHEYFNQNWDPIAFSTMARWLEPAKLDFACSAHLLDHVHTVNLTEQQRALLAEIPDAHFRESVRDVIVNQTFRRDYWVRGARRTRPLEILDSARQLRVVLSEARAQVTFKTAAALGEVTLSESIYVPLLDQLADHQPRTLGELEAALAPAGLSYIQVLEAVLVLAGKGSISLAQDADTVERVRERCRRLNLHLLDKARHGGDINYLASPVTGGAVPVDRFGQLFLLRHLTSEASITEMAAFVQAVLVQEGRHLLKDDKPLTDPEESLAELRSKAKEFSEKRIPVLKALGIA